MAVNLGINIQRSPNRINQQLREAGVIGKYPKLLLDFADNYYLANGGSKTLANAVTHARAGNATMTDGYGPELIDNGTFSSSDLSGWTAQSATLAVDDNKLLVTNNTTAFGYGSYEFATEVGKTYIFEAYVRVIDDDGLVRLGTSLGGSELFVNGYPSSKNIEVVFTATTTTTYLRLGLNVNSNGAAIHFDNVSVREMPVLKWGPHNLLQYSQQVNLSPWQASSGGVSSSPSRTADAGTAPDGTQTADRVQFDLNGGTTNTDQSRLLQTVSGDNVTFAVWLKSYDGSSTYNMQLAYTSGGGEEIVVTGDWQLFEMSQASSTSRVEIKLRGNQTPTHSDTADVLVWGAHLYRSDLGGMVDNPDRGDSYVPTTSSAKYLPRIGHHVFNGNAWVNEGVLAESEARTNIATDSDMSSAEAVGSTRTADNAVSPDGNENAFTLTASSTAPAYIRYSGLLTSGESYAVSVYAKAGTHDIIRIANVSSSTSGQWFDLTNGTLLTNNGANNTATIQDVGNGWYRCTRYFDSVTTGSSDEIFIANSSADGATSAVSGSTIHLYGFQIENNATSSSFIPTSGSSVTRAAETFTIPSANLPWPTPQSITGNVYSGTDPVNITGAHTFTPTIADDSSTKVVRVKWTQTINTGTRTRMRFRNAANSLDLLFKYYNGSGTFEEIIVTSIGFLWIQTETGIDVDISDITLEEINPLSVSIGMEGRMTFADTDDANEALLYRWYDDADNRIQGFLSTFGTLTGGFFSYQEYRDTADSVITANDYYDTGILTSYNTAARYGSTFVNAAHEGVALTANTTPVGLPDLSSTDMTIAHIYMGTISEFRIWDKDITDAGLVEATNPSLEPSLSLEFLGTGTNSFVVNNWSE